MGVWSLLKADEPKHAIGTFTKTWTFICPNIKCLIFLSDLLFWAW